MITNSLTTLPLPQLKRVVGIREQIESLELELSQLLGASAAVSTNGVTPRQKQDLGTATPRLRWSSYNGARVTQSNLASGSSRLSPTGRAKISAVVTARWERYRAAKAKLLKTR